MTKSSAQRIQLKVFNLPSFAGSFSESLRILGRSEINILNKIGLVYIIPNEVKMSKQDQH